MNRRRALRQLAASGLGLSAINVSAQTLDTAPETKPIKNGRLSQSIVHWCFERAAKWTLDQTCEAAVKLGCKSVEGVGPDKWDILKKYNLKCAYTGVHGFVKGTNNPAFWDDILPKMHKCIDQCTEAGNPNIITFVGFADTTAQGGSVIAPDQGKKNCVEFYKKLMAHAEEKGVNLVLEHLNSRDSAEMKGHPGYAGDNLDYCAEIIRTVGSPRMKLLFDIYHVQIMHGDLIRRLEECKDIIGHIHTAGNPGRVEIGANQEINYPAVMRKLVEIGYQGFVGHEFIPTVDPMKGLLEAVTLCDV